MWNTFKNPGAQALPLKDSIHLVQGGIWALGFGHFYMLFRCSDGDSEQGLTLSQEVRPNFLVGLWQSPVLTQKNMNNPYSR